MIIGIAGKKRSGKDTIADFLIKEYGFIKYGFADPIKEIAKIIFGFNEEQLYGDKKGEIDENWKIKPRDFFQKFGTDYGQFIFPEHFPDTFKNVNKRSLWVLVFNKWYLKKKREDPYIKVIINDVRFNHEFECIQKLGGYIMKVERDNNKIEDNHISENELNFNEEFNYIIKNNGSKEELYEKITEIIN